MNRPVVRSYDSAADVETVFAALAGELWAVRKAEELHDDSRTVRREVSPDGAVVLVVSRALPDGVPGFLQRFLPSDGRAVQTDSWGPAEAGVRRGTWQAELPGAPVEIGGTMRLEAIPTGTRYTIAGDVRVKVPLIGGKAEAFVADMIGKLTDREHDVLQGMLGT